MGQVVGGRFRVLYAIAAGGMGAVYEARDELLGRRVALKVIRPELLGDPIARARFRREALATAAVTHPALVTLHDLALDGDPAYFVMELIDGQTLDALLHREAGLHWPRALRLAIDVLDALDTLHAAGIVHRDVKPSNLMVVGEGERERARLIDLGVARLLTAPSDDARTASGVAVGTPAFMAPEQLAGERVGPSVDIYAMGLVLYKSLTGLHPFSSGAITNDGALPSRPDAIEPIHMHARDVPEAVSALVSRMLARAPGKRPSSAGDVARELRAILARVGAKAPASAQRPRAASEISTPGGSEPGYQARGPIDPRDVSTVDAPVGRESLPSAAASIPGARSALMPLAIGIAVLTALASLGAWAAIGGASAAPPEATAPTSTATVPSIPTATTDTIPRGIAPEAVPLMPATRGMTHRALPPHTTPSDVTTPTEPTAVTTATATTPIEPEAVASPEAVAPPETITPPEAPQATETIEALPSSPGQRPASRLRIQYVGSSGTDQTAVSASLDPRIERCIAASRHYANRTVVAFRVTVEADARVSDARATSDDGSEAERACVAEALRSAPWPSTGARRQTYVRVTALL